MRLLTIPSISRVKALAIGLFTAMLLSLSLSAAAGAATSSITVYKNKLKTSAQRAQIQKRGKGNCNRKASDSAVKFQIGSKTRECRYLVPVVGRDLEVRATGRIFSSTPKSVKPRVYLGLSLRQNSDGSRYEFAVYPAGRKYQIRKILSDGTIKVLTGGKAGKYIKGFGDANRMTFQAYNGVAKGKPKKYARLVGLVNGKALAVTQDSRGNELEGRDTTFSISSSKGARGAYGSFSDIRVRMPSPFQG